MLKVDKATIAIQRIDSLANALGFELVDGVYQAVRKTAAPKKAAAKTTRKYRRQYRRDCDECPRKFKGAVGLAIHKARAHKS